MNPIQRQRILQTLRTLVLILFILQIPTQVISEITVFFNVNTHKVHQLSCSAAQRCTVNCISLPRSDAYRRGGVACKICGG